MNVWKCWMCCVLVFGVHSSFRNVDIAASKQSLYFALDVSPFAFSGVYTSLNVDIYNLSTFAAVDPGRPQPHPNANDVTERNTHEPACVHPTWPRMDSANRVCSPPVPID